MQIILLERVAKLGQMGDVVNVKDGYARNFLLPQGKAQRATKGAIEAFENRRAQLEADNLKARDEAQDIANRMDGLNVALIRQSSEAGHLFGSVTSRDVAEAVTEAGYTITRNQVVLDRAIKTLGIHPLMIKLHPEVETEVGINIARSMDEAEAQLRGEQVIGVMDDDEDEDDFLDDVAEGEEDGDGEAEEETAAEEEGETEA